MKTILTVMVSLFVSSCFGQINNNNVHYSVSLSFRPATIQLVSDMHSTRSSVVNNVQQITYIDLPAGNYTLHISGQGQPTTRRDSIVVKEGQPLILQFTINGPCLYDHPKGYVPTCPRNHRDQIIPIVYGLVATPVKYYHRDKKDMTVKYAGCVVTDCDPQYYCKEHDVEF